VEWRAWGAAAFAEAAAADRPVLLDIGAVWCHWCHVMDAESYENDETAALINRHFVPMKVDRDERPDVDARYQRAVQMMTGQGGWPLTAFLTPEGEVFYGGTYFPPESGQGRPSFRRVLQEIARIWADERARVLESTRSIQARLDEYAHVEAEAGVPRAALIADAIEDLARAFDPRHGGFGQAPKFPNPGALDLLLDHSLDHGESRARRIVAETLSAMGRGGIFDQLGGGFHRYSVDARWIIPHFEKMAGDNGPLLATCAKAYGVLGDPALAETAGGIIDHYADIAPDIVAAGGFPASQDADYGFDNDGDYWTWTDAELRAILGESVEYRVARLHFGLDDSAGAMHLDPARHVLFRAVETAEVARRLGIAHVEAQHAIAGARARLKAARDRRPAPLVDTTLFAGWVALVASGHIDAARYLGRDDARARALGALDRVWREGWTGDRGLLHRLDDPASVLLLEDHALAALAFIDAFELTQEAGWLDRARALADCLATGFLDAGSGAFRDRAGEPDAPIASLERVLTPITDAPTPSGNGSAALALLRLATLTGDERYGTLADGVLRAFAGSAARLSGSAATWLKALAWRTLPVTTVVVVEDPRGGGLLLAAALATYRPRTAVLRLRPGDPAPRRTPPELAAMMSGEAPRAYVCSGRACAAPVEEPADLRRVLREFRG
jgi:hypothetical protein